MSTKSKSTASNANEGALKFIRPAELASEKVKGVILTGTYVGAIPNFFDKNKSDFKFQLEDGSTVVINHTGSLAFKLKNIEPGAIVEISYAGKKEMKSGAMKGKLAHQFEVSEL